MAPSPPPRAPAAPSRGIVRRLDGPSLPHLRRPMSSGASSSSDPPDPSLASLLPALVPPSPPPRRGRDAGPGDDGGQFLLTPEPDRIVVRSALHGRRICELRPDGGGGIRAVVAARLPRRQGHHRGRGEGDDRDDDEPEGEWVVLASCSGTIQEWSLSDLSGSEVWGEGVRPRRTFWPSPTLDEVSRKASASGTKDGKKNAEGDVKGADVKVEVETEVIHLSSPSGSGEGAPPDMDGVLYALCTTKTTVAKGSKIKSKPEESWLAQFDVPPFHRKKRGGYATDRPLALEPLARVKTVSSKGYKDETLQRDHVCVRKGDAVFAIKTVYRPASRGIGVIDREPIGFGVGGEEGGGPDGHVFVALCSSRGVAIFRDSSVARDRDRRHGEADASRSAVHFGECLRTLDYYTEEQSSFCSAAVSGTDLALGRRNGHVEVLDGVFENAATYLDAVAKDGETAARANHPSASTVRRTLLWHSHPVRTLAFSSVGGGGATTLLSGGDECVLALWTLDRQEHRPSDYVARVGRGAIVHLECCGSGRIYAFCADDSVSCYRGSNRERIWTERGLGSGRLHQEDEANGEGGPIRMISDPSTKTVMLTNLPGAPGEVRWYDPGTGSVVGTLEVAPYNHVSRRDPTADPHIPAPSVTHMALGNNGKDLVTVDTVWTENLSLGIPRNLEGPKGTVLMNVCTSVKFWSRVDSSGGSSRKRGRGDGGGNATPGEYHLATSTAAPHGRDGEVTALAIAPAGNVACTLSGREDAYRVWAKNDADATAAMSTPWKCLYRVRTPSGHVDPASLAFSSDGTVLAVSYGSRVTLWDHSVATLLTSLSLDDSGETVRSVDFLSKDDDAMLLTTANQLGVKSPFGGLTSCYLGDDEWSFDVGSTGKEWHVSAALPLRGFRHEGASYGCYFGVSAASDDSSKSLVTIVRGDGSVMMEEGTGAPMQWQVDGEVQSLLDRCADDSFRLLAITKDGQMFSLSSGPDDRLAESTRQKVQEDALARAPILKLGSESTSDKLPRHIKRRKVSIGLSHGVSGDARGFEFPMLSGKITSAFIVRSFGRRG